MFYLAQCRVHYIRLALRKGDDYASLGVVELPYIRVVITYSSQNVKLMCKHRSVILNFPPINLLRKCIARFKEEKIIPGHDAFFKNTSPV